VYNLDKKTLAKMNADLGRESEEPKDAETVAIEAAPAE